MTSNPARSRWFAAMLSVLAMPAAGGREPAKQDDAAVEQQRAQMHKANAAVIDQQARQHWEPQLQAVLFLSSLQEQWNNMPGPYCLLVPRTGS